MRRVYLLVYSDSFGSRDEVKAVLNEMPEVLTWRTDLPHSFYVVSEMDAKPLAERLRSRLGSGRFLITEITSNRGGWLTSPSWSLFRTKKLP